MAQLARPYLLLVQIVEDKRLSQLRILLGLLQREAFRIEGNKYLAFWPFFNGLVEQPAKWGVGGGGRRRSERCHTGKLRARVHG